jgi:hypothetical protein
VPHPSPRFRFRSALTSVALVLLAAMASQASASERANPLAAIARDVRAGQTIELRWPGLPRDFDELEILLSIDDGRTFPIRVSPELEAREGRYVWHVPNLASGTARLRVRANLDGAEREFEPSQAFTIVANIDAPAELDLVHEGDWWRGLDARRSHGPCDLRDDSRPSLAESEATRDFATSPRIDGERPTFALVVSPIPASHEAQQPALPARDAKPSFVPARK